MFCGEIEIHTVKTLHTMKNMNFFQPAIIEMRVFSLNNLLKRDPMTKRCVNNEFAIIFLMRETAHLCLK